MGKAFFHEVGFNLGFESGDGSAKFVGGVGDKLVLLIKHGLNGFESSAGEVVGASSANNDDA